MATMPSTLSMYELVAGDKFTEISAAAEEYYSAEALSAQRLRSELADGKPRIYDAISFFSGEMESDTISLAHGMARIQLQSTPEYTRQPHVFKAYLTRAEGKIALKSYGIIHIDSDTRSWVALGSRALFRYERPTADNERTEALLAYRGYIIPPVAAQRYER